MKKALYAILSVLFVAALLKVFVFRSEVPVVQAQLCGNEIACENLLPGNPASEWDIVGVGDTRLQGYATEMSVNRGETVYFKIDTTAQAYRLDIYRMGYYGGMGARRVATILPTVAPPQVQPECFWDENNSGLIDCGNWNVSASWNVPSNATSGIYFARLVRTDGTTGASHIVFIVRNDSGGSQLLFQTSDTSWQAYNYFGTALYWGGPGGSPPDVGPSRAYKVSYNRPFATRETSQKDWVFHTEYPMVRWLESNGYDVSYFTGVDSDRRGHLIRDHRVFLSVGHDEYWSAGQRNAVEAARDAGVHLAFFSGNSVFWKTRWEASMDGTATPYRTLVSYKETHANAKIDPLPNVWTGTWVDPRFSPPADGGRSQHTLIGSVFGVNGCNCTILVPQADGRMRFWRNTRAATLPVGEVTALAVNTLGEEFDEDRDDGQRPPGQIRLSTTVIDVYQQLKDYGNTIAPGTATHNLTFYRHPSGALVFGAATMQWAWGLDRNHDKPDEIDIVPNPDVAMQQATVNLFADMGVQPTTMQAGLVAATASTDATPPLSTITFPAAGATLQPGQQITVTGTASDVAGLVGGIEVSVDNGTTWHPATGRETWGYAWRPLVGGTVTILSRAADDSGNIETSPPSRTVSVGGTKLSTTTAITSDTPDPSVVGQTVTVNYAVAVVPPGTGTPTGSVTVSDGVNSCTASVAAGTCSLALNTSGARNLTATYSGDAGFNGSGSSVAPHTVNMASTTTTITSDSPDPSVVGQTVTVNYSVAVVAPGTGTPTGSVTVSDGINSCTGTVAAGACSMALSTPGARNLTATYAGTANYNGSASASAPHTVNVASTTTAITSDTPDPSPVGQSVTVNYTVAVISPGSGTPTGSVTVSDGINSCTGTVAAGTCSLALNTQGARSLTATYSGDTRFNGSASPTAPHTVEGIRLNTTTGITSNTPNPSLVGQSVTVNYTVAVAPPESGTPTGSVTVSDGVNSCTGTVAAGACSLTLNTPGARNLTATYLGDASFNGSASPAAPHTVTAASTTTAITSDTPDPSVVGQSVLVNYAVAVISPGSGTPTGSVTVTDGINSCTGTVAAGSCSLTLITQGARNLTATYLGSTNFSGSASSDASHTVNSANTTTTITSDTPDPSLASQTVTVNFTVAVVSPGTGTPTGSVTVSDGVNSCTAAVAAGTCSMALTTPGARSLTATYSGDTRFNGSTSLAVSHTVNVANTTTAITSDTPDPSVLGQAVTVNYTVTVVSPGTGTPTGSVTVSDGVNSCTATAAAGSCTVTLNTRGTRSLRATYAGGSGFNGSTSPVATHTVTAAGTTTTITSDTPDPSLVGQAVPVRFTVVVAAPGSGTPTGSVTVSDGVNSCTGTVAAGTCSLTLNTQGARNLTATYAGTANFTASASPAEPHTVDAANTTTAITSDTPDPSLVGQAVAVRYTVAVVSPGSGTPTGSVTVSDGINSCSATVAAGVCSLTINTQGTQNLTATYAGDTRFNGSASPTASHTVTAGASTSVIYVSSSSNGTVGGVAFTDEDILAYNILTSTWSMYLDGSDVGLDVAAESDIDAFSIMPDGSILLSFLGPTTIPNVGSVDDSDIVRFIPTSLGANTSGVFELYFQGADVGLTTDNEDIDAIYLLPNGDLVLSTFGAASVTGVSGIADEDLILFRPTTLGTTTAGTWSMYLDGSDVGLDDLATEDVRGVWLDGANGDIYLSTQGAFSVTGASGDGADIFVCAPLSVGLNSSCAFRPFWDGSANGFGAEVLDGFAIQQQ